MKCLTAIAVLAGVLAAGCAAKLSGNLGGAEEGGLFQPLTDADQGPVAHRRLRVRQGTSLGTVPELAPGEGQDQPQAEPPDNQDSGPGDPLPNFLLHRSRYEALAI